MRCAGLLLWCLLALQAAAVEAQRQFEKQRSLVQAPASAVQRRTASPVDAFGNPVPDSVAIPNIPRAKPPARVTSSAGYLELELVLETVDLLAECEVFRNDADETEPSISCFKGACVTLVKLASLKVDASYTFTTHSVRKVTDGVTGQVFEFHGPRSHPITFVTAGLPDWQLAIPETTSLGSIVMRLSWEEPNTGGSTILGYQVEMETNLLPGWQMIYDGQYDPSVKHLVLQNLSYGTTYFYNVYAINAIGRSKPISTAYTVAVPLEKTYFYPLSTDPSIARDPIPDFIIADVPTDLTIRAKNPVTEWFEVDSTHRNYLAAVHDACELNSERTMCLPVPEQHPDYQDHRQRLNQVPDCCYATVPNGDGTYSLNYTGNKTGIYSLMVYAIFSDGLWGQYWDNAWFYGLPVLSKVDANISFEWGHREVTALAGDHITARWVGFLLGPTTDEYTIYVKADDSVRVWFQGDLVIDYWDSSIPCCPELWTRQLIEKDKFYSIKVEWKEMQGNAQLRLMWGITGKRKQIIPGANLWRGAPLESAPFRIVVHPGPPSVQTSGLIEPLERLRTAVSQRLYLQALDTMSNTVNSTDVQFEAYFYPPSYTNATVPLVFRSIPLMLQRQTEHIHDHLHFIDLVLLEPGNYTLELFLKGQGQLASSPIHFLATQDDVLPQMCTVIGPGSLEFIAGEETNFTLQLRDAFSNPVPHVDGVTVEVDLEFVEEIDANGTMDDRRLRNLTGGHYATATSITKGDFGSYFITYTGLRAGINLLTVKVNGLLIMGQEEQVIYNPPVQGQNRPLTVTGYWNERANGLMTIYAPARIPAECTTGVICAVVFHVRDTYGNRMLGDYHEQMQYRTVDAQCNPLLPEDPWCVPVDEGHCFQIFGEMHACELTPTIGGNFLLRLLVNGQDVSYGLWRESLGAYSLEGDSYIRGPTALLVNIGDINATTSTMTGPGRLLEGNVVGTPAPVLVQLKDQYGNDRIVTGSDFLQRRNGISATLGDRELATTVYDNGTIEVTVLIFQAGFHNLRVRIGAGCIQVPVRDPCEDISGSPTTLLWWKEAEVSENGMTCQTPYAMEAGRQYHFTCTGRDVYGNINRDHELVLTSFFNYVVDPEGSEPPDGWFRGNLSANFNHTVAGSYLAADGRYHFDITLYRAGFYELIIEMIKVGSQPAIVLARNVQAEGRPVGEATYVLGFPSLPSFMSSVVGGFVTAAANVANEVTVQTRDRFGNAIEINNGADTVVAQLRGSSPVTLPFLHLIQGRYRGALVPLAAGPTLLEIRVAGEEIVGSPFDFLVTPGPMVTTNSLVEGFPSELTAGVLSCWNITLRDATQNHLLSGQFEADPTQLEPVSCTDVESYCFHTQLNGTFTCCINKTAIDVVPANFLVDTFPFTCQIRGDNIFGPVDMKLWPHPISPYWPDSSLKIGNGMLGPYDYPSYIDDQFGWQDWPTTYVRGVQNIDSGQQQQQLNRLRRWYTDGFYNVFKGDNAAILMCDVKGNHSLGNHTLGRPTRSLYRLPYTLNQELGVFEVELKFERIGYHKVFCSTAVRGGMNVEYRDTDGSILRRVEQGINISAPEQMPVDEEGGAARWDALLYPPRSANYTLILACRGRDAVLIFNNSLRATITTTDDTVDQEQLAIIGPLDLQAQTPYPLQAAWTSNSLSSSVQLRWFSDGGIPEELLPGEHLYNSKTLLSGYPKIIEVSDAAVVRRLQPENANEEEADGQQISAYQLHQFHHDSEDVTEAQAEAEVIPAADTEVEVHVPDSLGIIDPLPDPTKFHRLERRASDDYTDEDFEAVARSMQATTAVTPPDPPETIVLGSDQMTVRIAWIEPSGQNVTGYRVYVDGKLAYDGATDSVTREFTLMNCTRGELRDLAVAAVNAGGETLVPTVITRHCARRPFKPEPPTIVYVDCVKEASPPDRLLIDNHIRIAYKEPADNGGVPLSGWRIQRAQGESLAFRGVGPLFPIPENEVYFDDFNDLDGDGKIGLVWGEIYKYRVVAVNGIDIWDDESASDYTIVRCSNEAPEVPWWLQLNVSTTTTTTTATSNETFVADLATGFVWSVEVTTTTTTVTTMESSYAFSKLSDVDPRDCYLPQSTTGEYHNISAAMEQALAAFQVPPAPILSVAWSACNSSMRPGDPCKEFFPDRSDVVACARVEFKPAQPADISCPVEWYEIERNEEIIATVRPSQNGLVDAFTAASYTAAHYDGFWGTLFSCFATIPNRNLHDKQLYRIRAQNCRGWGAWSEELAVPVASPPAPVCGLWGFNQNFEYTCTQPGLSATPLNTTSAEFQWTLLQDAQLVDVANNFSRIQAEIGQVGPGEFVTFPQQLIGSYDPRALLGYELFMDDGLGGPFHLAYDGIGRRWSNTAKIFGLLPERTYRAFVRAVSFVGAGNASDMLYFKMAMPLPAPVNLSATSVGLKSVQLTWEMPYAETADALPVSQYIVQMAMEPGFDNWFDVQNSPADNTEYSILVTQLEPDFRYALRVLANSENGIGSASESLYFWAGLLPNEGPRLVQRVESEEGTIKIQWELPGGAMLGTGTRMEAVTTDWGARGYMWDPAVEDPKLVYDGFGHATTVQFTVANATCGRQYKVAMSCVTTIGEGPLSTVLDVTNARLPGVPRNVVVTNTTTSSVSIAWEEPDDTGCVPIHQYRILRYYPEAGFQVVGYASPADGVLQLPANRTYVDDGRCFFANPADDDGSCTCPPSCLQAGQLYRYQVQACVLGAYGVDTLELAEGPLGCGPNSNTVSAYAGDLSEAPRDIRLGEPEGSEVLLYWTAPSTDGLNGSSFSYEIEMDVGGVFTTLGLTTGTSFRITGLQLQFAYIFRISTYNGAGYVTRSNVIGYTATLPPAVPESASPVARSTWASSAFFQHPSMASTPVPEGVSIRFSATAVNGYAWAMVVETSNLNLVTPATMKDGTYAVGGAACYRVQQAVARAEVYFWRLGSDDNPSDPTGCFLSHGGTYGIVVYVQSVTSFDAGLNDGTLSGAIEFTVITGRSNTYYSSPALNSPLTESGVTLAFTPRRPGYGWAMILTEEQARSATKEHVYRLEGALGGPFCKHGPRQLFAYREEAWVFSGCLLTVGSRYTVLAYISGIGAHLDGTVDGVASIATSASNAFSTYPTISGPPSGDGITVQLRTRSSGYLWLMITVGPVALTIDLIKAGAGAVGASTCRVLGASVDDTLQSFDLTDCKLNSGPEYALHSYIEGPNSAGLNDGSFAGTVTFQVTPSNIFVVYPSIITETTGLGFTFQMTASFVGRFWCLLREGNAAITVEEIKSGTGALGLQQCQRSSETLTATLQELVLTNCQLSQDRLYSLYVYIEDFNGNNDGIMAGPITFYVLDTNSFEDSPRPVENSATLDGVRLSFMASREGFAWAALFDDYTEAAEYFLNAPAFLDRYYPENNESCAPAGVPVLASGNFTNMTLAGCGLNYSATYWALVYIEGLEKTKSGAISAPVEVFVPRSNDFPYTPLVLQARPYFVDVEVATVRPGFLWILIVHENHTDKVDMKAVKSGVVPSGEVVCSLPEIVVNQSVELHRVEQCQLLATFSYFAFFYVEGPVLAEDTDGSLGGPVLVWYNSSNQFVVKPRIIQTMTTNVFYFKFTPEVNGNFWAVVADNADEGFVTVWSIKSMQYGQPAADCRRQGKFVTGGVDNTEEFLFCYFERGPTTYRVFIYLEDTLGQNDGIMETMGIIVPGSAELSNEFLTRPYLVEPETIRGAKIFFQPRRTGYAWAGLMAESSWLTRAGVNNSNGNHADRRSIEIYDIMFFVDMVGSNLFCYYSAVPITANADYTWEFLNCGLTPGVRYRLFVYIIGEEYWDVAVDPDAVFRSPSWNQWHRDNGRVSNGVLVEPPFSNYWAWPDGEPYISKGPHGMGLDVTFTTGRPQALVWAIVQDATSTNFTINAVKTAQLAWGPAGCRQLGAPALDAATYTLTLFGCSLLPAPRKYVLILYTEDQAIQNDGMLSDPIFFEVPVSNGFIIPPALVGEAGLDTGVSLSFEASSSGRVWVYISTLAQANAFSVTIPNVKDAVNAFDTTNCMVAGLAIPASLQVITMPNCPLVYLSSYVVYVYVEDSNAHLDGTLATPLLIDVGASNSFEVEPALLSVPTTDQVDFRFTPTKLGRVWVVVTPAASLVEPPTRSHMKANVGAVGALSCRVSGSPITPVEQTYVLTGCVLDPGQIYALYVYVEDHRDRGDGTLSRIVFVKVIRSNNFAISPVLLTLPTLDGFDVRFQAMVSGRAWAMAVDAIGGSGVNALSIRSLQGALGGADCQFQDFPIDASLQVWNFTDCRFEESKTYMIFIYIEAWPAVTGDGTLSGPMIASFFDASNVSTEDTGADAGGDVLTIEEVPIVSNWFREDPRQSGPASPGGVTLTLRAAHASGRLWVMITRYRPQVAAESVQNGWNAIGGPGCQRLDAAIDEQEATVQLSECGLLRGRYYYAFAYVAGPEGGLNGTLSPAVEIFVPTVSNDFSQSPRLVSTPLQDDVHFTFAAVQQFGFAWVMIIDSWLAYSLTVESVKAFVNAVGGSNCRKQALSIGTAAQDIVLGSSFPNAGDGCDLMSNGMYVVVVYVEDINGLNDGTLAQLPIRVSPKPAYSNRIAAGPVISVNPVPSDVYLTFAAAIPGRYWAFILPSDRTNVFTLETAKFMDLNPDTVGQAGCRKNNVEMGSGATYVHLTNCDLVMSGAGFTSYSAFVYVEDNSGKIGDLSAAVTVASISNTFVPPFPRIVAFETDGTLSVEVRVNNSGRLWSRIVYSSLYTSTERYSGAMSLYVLKQWQAHPDNGPSYGSENCSIDALDVTVELDSLGMQVPIWLNFSNCTFTSGTEYMIAIYAEDSQGNDDGEIVGLKLDKYYNASNYFLVSPAVVGTAMADTFTVQFHTWAAGVGWCAITLPEDAKYLTGAAVMSGQAGLGGPDCCKNSAGFLTSGGVETLTLTGCGLGMDTEYRFFMYISGGALDGTLSSGYPFTTFGSLGHIRVQWLQKETDEGGAIDRYRVFLNGTQVYDDYGFRSSLEQSRAGSPPRWVRVADLACTPGLSYEVTLSGRNFGGWSPLSQPLQTGCFLRPGTISNLREVSSSVSADGETASLRVAWTAPQDAAGAETAYYNIYRDRGLRQALFELIGSTTVTQFDDTGLVPGLDYGYQVTAVNAFGEGPVSDVLFLKIAGTPVIETPKVDLLGILNQAGLQLTPSARTGELDQVDGVLQVYSSDRPRTLQALNYGNHRAAHLVVFGTNIVTIEDVDLAGTTAEGDPCLEAELKITAPAKTVQFCAGDGGSAPSITLKYGEIATISWRTGQLSSPAAETGGWRISLRPVP